MDMDLDLEMDIPKCDPKLLKRANLAKIFGFISLGFAALALGIFAIEVVLAILTVIPVIGWVVSFVTLIIAPILDLVYYTSLICGPAFGLFALIYAVLASKAVKASEVYDEKAMNNAKQGLTFSTVGTCVSVLLLIMEIFALIFGIGILAAFIIILIILARPV